MIAWIRYRIARRRGCTGWYSPRTGIQHDGPTCPVHEGA